MSDVAWTPEILIGTEWALAMGSGWRIIEVPLGMLRITEDGLSTRVIEALPFSWTPERPSYVPWSQE